MTLWTDRRRVRIEYDRKRQVFGDASGLRGEKLLVREAGIRRPLCKAGVVVEASPASSFELSEAEFALQFLVVALDTPA